MAAMKFATKDGHRPTVLVVEDEFIIALDLSETVRDLGFKVEGPFADNQNAFVAIDEELPDCAILDVKIADGEVYPLADALADAGVPLIFHSGHIPPVEIAERYPQAQACAKPCPPDRLISMIGCAIEEAETTH
jgi:DNA-binding NtrC family response regulator